MAFRYSILKIEFWWLNEKTDYVINASIIQLTGR